MPDPRTLLPLAIAAAIVLLLRRLPPETLVTPTRLLAARWTPLAVSLLAIPLYWWFWGSLRQVPVVHDEIAYVLQARIFASGRWAAPAPPLPEFFEQFHVLVAPTLAPKYPPGHALLMVPGVWLGLPGLTAVLASAATAGLLFALARRVAGGWMALLALLLWVIAPVNLRFRPSYFSVITTSLLWLVGWWVLLRYRDDGRLRWLVALAIVVAWGGITRPLTMMAYAAPAGVAALVFVARRRAWRQVPVALVAGVAICAIIPLWSRASLATTRENPYTYYSRAYVPFDKLGFGVDTTEPLRPLNPDMVGFHEYLRPWHERHTPANLPGILLDRLGKLRWDSWGPYSILAVPALIGLAAMSAELAFGVATCVALLAAYLLLAYPTGWSIYYLEVQPVVALLTATGLRRLDRLAVALHARLTSSAPSASTIPALGTIVGVMALVVAPFSLAFARRAADYVRVYHREFERMVALRPDPRAIVFIRYAPDHDLHMSLVANEPDPTTAPVWRVYDRGPDNERLMRLAPDRAVYLYDEVWEGRELRRRLRRLEPGVATLP